MVINLFPIINMQGGELLFSGRADDLADNGEIRFSVTPQVSGKIINIGNTLELNADVTAEIKALCDYCCKEISFYLDFNLVEVLKKEDETDSGSDNENIDVTYFKGTSIDISELVYNGILMNMPMKILCSGDCKGLCQKCGMDLNEGQCGCGENDIDPRLEILNKLL